MNHQLTPVFSRNKHCTHILSLGLSNGRSNLQDCCDKCLFRPSTFICRESTSSCDVVEMCSGKHGKCPSNKKECSKHHSLSSNATDFNSSNVAACGASGCTKDQQCQALSSPTNVLTLSCTQDTSSCQVSCTSGIEINGSLDCQVLPHYYSDGTGCGNSGTCTNGACVGGKNIMKSWCRSFIQNLTFDFGLFFWASRQEPGIFSSEEHCRACHFQRHRRGGPDPLLPEHLFFATTKEGPIGEGGARES